MHKPLKHGEVATVWLAALCGALVTLFLFLANGSGQALCADEGSMMQSNTACLPLSTDEAGRILGEPPVLAVTGPSGGGTYNEWTYSRDSGGGVSLRVTVLSLSASEFDLEKGDALGSNLDSVRNIPGVGDAAFSDSGRPGDASLPEVLARKGDLTIDVLVYQDGLARGPLREQTELAMETKAAATIMQRV